MYMTRWNKATGVASAVLSSITFGLIPLFTMSLLAAGMGAPTILCYRFAIAFVRNAGYACQGWLCAVA